MRIISGIYKGRIIEGASLDGTRPTMDRVKEAIFSMIQNKVEGSICLDLFAGSGSLGIEALSNGASSVYFIDKNKKACQTIKRNFDKLNITDNIYLINDDYKKALSFLSKKGVKFDIVFLDPPYNLDVIKDILIYLSEHDILNDNGLVICEHTNFELEDNYGKLSLIKNRHYGVAKVKIYEKA